MFFFKSKDFSNKKLGEIKNYSSVKDLFRYINYYKLFLKILVVGACFFVVTKITIFAVNYGKTAFSGISKSLLKMTLNSLSAGDEIQTDELGQISFMIIGYGGENHDGGYLADTMIIASYNPQLKAVTMLSIPRDIYIQDKSGYSGKLNGLFAYYYHSVTKKDLNKSARMFAKKMKEITGVDINYYALVSFKGFVELIDSLGGIDVNVPETLVDTQYPTLNGGYTTFKVEKGLKHMSGETALKYARSRHSTSDFSRSQRQQLIIKSVMNKLLSSGELLKVSRIKELYNSYTKMVVTNLGLKKIFSLVKYMDKIDHFFSFGYVVGGGGNACIYKHFSVAEIGCFLYFPPRESFNGMSVILPIGADADSISDYTSMEDFAFRVIYNQKYLIENAKIQVLNGIDPKVIKKTYGYNNSLASNFAVELKRNAFNIQSIANSKKYYTSTVAYIKGTGDYSGTIDTLKMFLDIDHIYTGTNSEYDVVLVLGNNFLK